MAHSVEYSLKKAKYASKRRAYGSKKVYESILVAFPGNVSQEWPCLLRPYEKHEKGIKPS